MGLHKIYAIDADPRQIAKALRTCLKDYGEMHQGYVYGDWSFQHKIRGETVHTARAFEQEGFTSVMVSTKLSGQDRSDSRLIIDTLQCLHQQPSINIFMIVSGDADFAHLSRTIKGAGKRVIVSALTQSASGELLAIASPFISIENLLNLSVSAEEQTPTYNWDVFVQLMISAEKTLEFVSLKYFRDKWLKPSMGPVDTPEQRHRLVNEAINAGIVTAYKFENPGKPFPTAAIKLNQDNFLVKKYIV